MQQLKLDPEDISSEELQFNVLGAVEKIYAAVFQLEDALGQPDDADCDRPLLEQTRLATKASVMAALNLGAAGAWGRVDTMRFVSLLALAKGRRAIFRALRVLDAAFSTLFLQHLVQHLEYLSVFLPNTPPAEIESFVNLVLSPLVPFVSEAPTAFVVAVTGAFLGKENFFWLLFSRPGLILLCILMSRIEIGKSAAGPDIDHDSALAVAWPQLSARLFAAISERLVDFFSIPTLRAAASPKLAFDGGDYYVWQFMALVALNVDADNKKFMIVELRDKIMSVVQHGAAKDIANLNIFLNVLGLDSSQLAGTQ